MKLALAQDGGMNEGFRAACAGRRMNEVFERARLGKSKVDEASARPTGEG
jgi:hypothetical protein